MVTGIEEDEMKGPKLLAMSISTILLSAGVASATSSSTVWTPMTLDIQSPGVFHLGIDNYFTVGKRFSEGGGSFPTDLTLPEVGVAISSKVQMEFGLDYFGPADDPWFGNHAALVSSTGKAENTGYMVAFDHAFVPTKDKEGNEFSRLVFAADFASGKNLSLIHISEPTRPY